ARRDAGPEGADGEDAQPRLAAAAGRPIDCAPTARDPGADLTKDVFRMADSRANAIVIFSADNYNTTRERLMGRQSATEGFLRALVRHGGLDEFWCYCLRREDLDIFRQRVSEFAG